MPAEFKLSSLDGRTNVEMSAFATRRVTEDLRPINWRVESRRWKHLRGINFPNLGPNPIIDMLIGIDYAELHYSLNDVQGVPGQQMARLTPLGWTCIAGHNGEGSTNFNSAFFISCKDNNLNSTLQRFWELESLGTKLEHKPCSKDENDALKKVEESMCFKDDRYQVSMPWKEDPKHLPDNYNMAVKRLENMEEIAEKHCSS